MNWLISSFEVIFTATLYAATWSCSGLCGYLHTHTIQPVIPEVVAPPLLVTSNGNTAEEAFQLSAKKCDGKTPMLTKAYLVKRECALKENEDPKWVIATIKDVCVKD